MSQILFQGLGTQYITDKGPALLGLPFQYEKIINKQVKNKVISERAKWYLQLD